MEKKDQMLTYNLTATGSDSLYESLYKCIKNDILQGKLCAGEKLPSKRSFAKNLGISVITVENAYGQLSDEGYIDRKSTRLNSSHDRQSRMPSSA